MLPAPTYFGPRACNPKRAELRLVPMMEQTQSQLRAQAMIDALTVVQASRVLTDEESAQLERALRRLGPKREVWRWSAKEDRRLIMFMKRRGFVVIARKGALVEKPFQKHPEIQQIAADMGRGYWAVMKRIQRLRKRMQCPSAHR